MINTQITFEPWRYAHALTADEIREIEARGILPDGFRARVPLTLMDSAHTIRDVVTPPSADLLARSHSGSGFFTDADNAEREERYADHAEALTNAWRSPAAAFTPPQISPSTFDASSGGGLDIYDLHERRLSLAWLTPPAAEPVAAAPSPQQHDANADLYAQRDARLINAWKDAR
jgi:hypothetical protein